MTSARKAEALRVCVDRILPEDEPLPINDRLAVRTMKRWKPGRTLGVRFLDGDPAVHKRVEQIAAQWMEHANVRFAFGNPGDAVIRVSFAPGASWSLVGIDAQAVARDTPTMNLGWLTPEATDEEYERVVLHEFGHALGCIHEHQREDGVPWDRPAVYAYYTGAPYHWTPAQVDQNIFTTYSKQITQFSDAFDPASIMIYPIPAELTAGKLVVGWNTKLSPTDVDFIGRVYPRVPESVPRLEPGGAPLRGEITAERPFQDFRFDLAADRDVVVETRGATDLAMLVLGPDSADVVAGGDPGGGGLGGNVKVEEPLEAGTYLARVSHRRPGETGRFEIFLH